MLSIFLKSYVLVSKYNINVIGKCIYYSFSLIREGGPLAVEEIVLALIHIPLTSQEGELLCLAGCEKQGFSTLK